MKKNILLSIILFVLYTCLSKASFFQNAFISYNTENNNLIKIIDQQTKKINELTELKEVLFKNLQQSESDNQFLVIEIEKYKNLYQLLSAQYKQLQRENKLLQQENYNLKENIKNNQSGYIEQSVFEQFFILSNQSEEITETKDEIMNDNNQINEKDKKK